MRNLKRVLSLAIAAVMLMGMMIVGTSAADAGSFTDSKDITNLEAASVTTAIGIFDGYGDGSFGAKDYVTRAQMATIICKILYGANVNANNFKGTGRFSDVVSYQGGWAEGYINMCASQGIINGYQNSTNFGPGDTVTTWQAALMLQRALGYWPEVNGQCVESINELSVSSRASGLKMYGDLTLGVNAPLTRNDVAEMVFNTITKNVPVEWNGIFGQYRNANVTSTTSAFGGVVFKYAETLAYQNFGLVYAEGEQDVFGRPATTWGYGKIKATSDMDPISGNLVNYDVDRLTQSLVTVAQEPVVEYTTAVTGRTLYNALGLSGTANAYLYVDGKNSDAAITGDGNLFRVSIARNDTDTKGIQANLTDADDDANTYITGNGVLTQVYENPEYVMKAADRDPANYYDDYPYIIVVINTYLMDVETVTEATNRKEAFVTVAPREVADPSIYAYPGDLDADYETEDFNEDDVVLITAAFDREATYDDAEYKIQSMQLADTFRGELTRYTETRNTMHVDGVAYSFDFNASQDANTYVKDRGVGVVGEDVRVYMDNYGYAMEVDGVEAEAQTNYALVLAVDKDSASVFHNNSAWAKLLLMDNTVVEAKFTWDDDELAEQWNYDNLADPDFDAFGNQNTADDDTDRAYVKVNTKETLVTNIQTIVTYTVDKDGVYTLYRLGDDGSEWTGLVTDTNRSIAYKKGNSSTRQFMNNSTVLIMPVNKAKDQYKIYTGVRTMPEIDSNNPTGTNSAAGKPAPTMVAAETGRPIANVIYTEAGVKEVVEKDLIYIASEGSPKYVNDKDLGPYCNFVAVINGEIVDLMVKGTANASTGVVTTNVVKVGAMYNGITKNKDDIVTKAVLATQKADEDDTNGDYLLATGIVKARKDIIGIGTKSSYTNDADLEGTAKYYTWANDVLVAYIDTDGNGKVVVSNPKITSLRTKQTDRVIYNVSDDDKGEITWLYVVDSSVGTIIKAGTSKTYVLYTTGTTDIAQGDVVQVGTKTAIVGDPTDADDLAALGRELSVSGQYTVTVAAVTGPNYELTVTTADSSVTHPTVKVAAMSAVAGAGSDADVEGGGVEERVTYDLTGKTVAIVGTTLYIKNTDWSPALAGITATGYTNIPTADKIVLDKNNNTAADTDVLTVKAGTLAALTEKT